MSSFIPNILSVVIIANFILSVLILARGFRSSVNWIFGFLALGSAAWSIGIMGFYFSNFLNIEHIWVIMTHLSASFIALMFLYFSLSFPNQLPRSKIVAILPLIPFLVILYYLLNTDFIVGNAEGIYYKINDGYLFYSIYITSYFLIGYVSLWYQRNFSTDLKQKQQILYIFLGAIITSGFGSLTNLIFPYLGIFNYTWLGPIFTFFLVASIAVAILKHNLFNIKVIGTEVLIFLLWIFCQLI